MEMDVDLPGIWRSAVKQEEKKREGKQNLERQYA